ncbi:MAG: MATE family efflux transporter [Polyangiaceae bacterium]
MTRARRELKALLRLSGPLILGFLGSQVLGIVDTAMVGRLGEVPLAAVAAANGLFFAITCFGIGVLLGADPLLSQAIGAQEGKRVEAVRKATLRLSLILTVPLTALVALVPWILGLFGVDAHTQREAGWFLLGRGASVLPLLLFSAFRGYLQARTSTRSIIIASIVGNVVNLFFNTAFIFGDRTLVAIGLPALGLPSLGVFGSGLASTLATVAMLFVLWRAQRSLEPLSGEGDDARALEALIKLGLPLGLTLVAEVGAFALVGVLAAKLGPSAASGHQVALTLASSTFIVTLAIGSATTVRVGQAVGRRDSNQARLTGLLGQLASAAFMCCTATTFILFAPELARLLSNKPEVIEASIPLLHIAAVFQIFDGAQAVGAGALRGIGDTKFVQIANIVGYYAIGLPVALLLAFLAGKAERGLWWGLTAGLVFVATMLFGRFWVLSRRPIERV